MMNSFNPINPLNNNNNEDEEDDDDDMFIFNCKILKI